MSDMFIKIGDIKGESMDQTHRDEIDILSWSWGMAQTGSGHMGGGGGAGKVSVQDLTFTKVIDASSPDLMRLCCTGEAIPEATLTVRKAGGTAIEYVVIKLHHLLVSNISTSGSMGEETLHEQVTLNFKKFEIAYQPQDEKGKKKGAELTMTWNIEANVADLAATP